MATTAGGLPYPVGTDKVVDGDDAIKNLALATDQKALQQWTNYTTVWSGDSGTPNLGSGGALNALYRFQGAKVVSYDIRLYVGAGNVPPTGGWKFALPQNAAPGTIPHPAYGVVELPGTGRFPLAGWVQPGTDASNVTGLVDSRGNNLIGGYALPAGSWVVIAGIYMAV